MSETLEAIIESDKIETFRQIVREKQYQEIDGVTIDMQTANLVCNVYDVVAHLTLPFVCCGPVVSTPTASRGGHPMGYPPTV